MIWWNLLSIFQWVWEGLTFPLSFPPSEAVAVCFLLLPSHLPTTEVRSRVRRNQERLINCGQGTDGALSWYAVPVHHSSTELSTTLYHLSLGQETPCSLCHQSDIRRAVDRVGLIILENQFARPKTVTKKLATWSWKLPPYEALASTHALDVVTPSSREFCHYARVKQPNSSRQDECEHMKQLPLQFQLNVTNLC